MSIKDLLPQQNPSLVGGEGQEHIDRRRSLVALIMDAFRQMVPSTYVSQVTGPLYTVQMQAAAEVLADFQLEAQSAFGDRFYDFLRGEFLYQVLGTLVFPDAAEEGYPVLEGDTSYREFLRSMVGLLLQGATPESQQQGASLLSTATFEIIEKVIEARSTKKQVWNEAQGLWEQHPGSAWDLDDQFTFELNVSDVKDGRQSFPEDPFILQENVRLVLKALKPAHTLYEYRHLFREVMGSTLATQTAWDFRNYHYEDARRFCLGARALHGQSGQTLQDRRWFHDVTRDFAEVPLGATLTILTGPNGIHAGGQEGTSESDDRQHVGRYRVVALRGLIINDSTPRAYTTSSGLSGTATVLGDIVEDPEQDWSEAREGEVLTFTSGPNVGTYRLKQLLGTYGGSVGVASGPATRVRVAQSTLRVDRRMGVATTGQSYEISLDRLGHIDVERVESEDVTAFFLDSPERRSFYTLRGPLVKEWGDRTVATIADVVVTVDGEVVEVAAVNPFTGEVTLAEVPGEGTVLVDYYWMKNPVLPFAGLNMMGVSLNQYHGPRTGPYMVGGSGVGALTGHRFVMSTVLSPRSHMQPLQISHRYLGFERAYTAMVSSPTTLLLNRRPDQQDYFERELSGVNVWYEGGVAPSQASPAWAISGQDSGFVNHGQDQGTYTLAPVQGSAAVYHRGVDLTAPSSINAIIRITSLTQSSSEGVFTGIGFGAHDNQDLYLCGLLMINGVGHVGLLADSSRMHQAASWKIGPEATLTASSQTQGWLQVPEGFRAGHRFQILTGAQAGVYTAVEVKAGTVKFQPPLPAPWDLFGNKSLSVLFEVRHWIGPFTYRMDVHTGRKEVQVVVSGEIRDVVVSASAAFPAPGTSSLQLPPQRVGQVFWGSLTPRANGTSRWSFARYGLVPEQMIEKGQSVVVDGDIPDQWSVFGRGGLQVGADPVDLRKVASGDLGYFRVEPFLSAHSVLDLHATVRAAYGSAGAGDIEVRVQDGDRVAILRSLLYIEDGDAPTRHRRILPLPAVSFRGTATPQEQGWAGPLSYALEGDYLITETEGVWTQDLPPRDVSDAGRLVEARFSGEGRVGVQLPHGADVRYVLLAVTPSEIRLQSAVGVVHAFAHSPEGAQTYRLILDSVAETVTLSVDDVVQAPVLDLDQFVGGVDADVVWFGQTTSVEWHYVHVHALPPSEAKRTLGIFLGGDSLSIDAYEIPRTDASPNPSSWQNGPVIEEMDWRVEMDIQIRRDPRWGVIVLRPDMDLPPYYSPEGGVAGSGYINETVLPSAGWINVEYGALPVDSPGRFGGVSFGATGGTSVGRTLWSSLTYSFSYLGRETTTTASPHMVLNQYNAIHSGELTRLKNVRSVAATVMDETSISLIPSHEYAQSVYKIVDQSTIWTSEHWSFDPQRQELTLIPDPISGIARKFSSPVVQVHFVPGRPVTATFLKNHPFGEGVTLLNEGTPPVPKSQIGKSLLTVVDGVAGHRDVEGTFYEDLEFFEVEDEGSPGLIAGICEGGPGSGISGFALDEGEFIYSPLGDGDPLGWAGAEADHFATDARVGEAVGAEVVHLRGSVLSDKRARPSEGISAPPLYAAGGQSPVLGVLGGGETFGSSLYMIPPPPPWLMRVGSVVVGVVEVPLAEDFPEMDEDLLE